MSESSERTLRSSKRTECVWWSSTLLSFKARSYERCVRPDDDSSPRRSSSTPYHSRRHSISLGEIETETPGRGRRGSLCGRRIEYFPPELTTAGGIVRRHVVDVIRRRFVSEHLIITDNTVLIRRPCSSNIATISQQHCASP